MKWWIIKKGYNLMMNNVIPIIFKKNSENCQIHFESGVNKKVSL